MEEWLTFHNIKDVTLFILAIWGAALSTFNWRQAVQKNRRCVEVSTVTAMPAYGDGNLGTCYAEIKATNTGHRPVTVTTIVFELPDNARLFPTALQGLPGMQNTPLPVTLKDGESVRHHISYRDIANALINSGRNNITELTPICEDSTGGIHRGKPWRDVNPEEMRKL